jgi:bleomycin hydrolase
MTPQEFARRWVDVDLDSYVCLVDDPRPSSPRNRVFTVEYLGNIVSGKPVTYLNVEMPLIKRLARESIVSGTPVWFGCDVAQMMEKDEGVWDANLFDYDAVYDTRTDFAKADRLLYGATAMTHAMLLTGVDVVGEGSDAHARRWRVENSWGTEKADKGFWTMNDSWFAEHVFEIAVPKSALPAELLPVLDTEPIVLPAWDPMGALAGRAAVSRQPATRS